MEQPAELTDAIETSQQKRDQSDEIKRLTEEYERKNGKVQTSPSTRVSSLSEIDLQVRAKMVAEAQTNIKRKHINFQKRAL